MKIKYLQVASFFLSFLLLACSGGNSSNSTPSSNQAAVGNLTVSISGLPQGLEADVTLTGTGVNRKITTSESITGLNTGNYSLSIVAVLDANYNYNIESSTLNITISENQTKDVAINYLTNEVISQGVITGFGSVYVNGTHFNTDATRLETDESDDENLNQLKLGMVVSVKGTLSANGVEGVAKSILHASNLRGLIDSIDIAAPSLTVLTQTILIDDQTIFHDTEFEELQITSLVSVDVVETESGDLLATSVKLHDDDPDAVFKLSGNIKELDETATTFKIFDITINYGTSEVNGSLVDEALVSVKSHQQIVENVFIAENIKVFSIDNDSSNNSDNSHRNHVINGFVTNFVSIDEFTINEIEIMTNDETDYKGGTADDISDGVRLNVHGRKNSDGKIVAKKVRFDKPEVIKVAGEVTLVDVENQFIEILGITFNVDNNTTFRDKTIEQDENFHLTMVVVGDWLKIDAFEQPDGSMLAKKVTRIDDTDETRIEGKIESFESPQFVIDGVTITVSDATDIEGPDQTSIDIAAFFALLSTDVELEVKGLLNEEGTLLATSIEFEDDDDDEEDNNKVTIVGDITDFVSEIEFAINGHAVTTDENTEYKHGGLLDLTAGIRVQVKGIVDENDIILASRIHFQNDDENSNRVEIEGEIDTFVSVNDFTVNDQRITVTESTHYKRGTIDDLKLGAEVEIDAYLSSDEIYIADEIKFEMSDDDDSDSDDDNDADEVEFKGTVDTFTSATEFTVNGHSITTDDATEYKNGEVADIALDVKIEVEGITLESGVILAQKIEFDDD